jgi:hypothetical protein
MCLANLHRVVKPRIGYKVMRMTDDDRLTGAYYTADSATYGYGIGRIYYADFNNMISLPGDDFVSFAGASKVNQPNYLPGFHILKSKKDVIKYLSTTNIKSNSKVVTVEYYGAFAEGVDWTSDAAAANKVMCVVSPAMKLLDMKTITEFKNEYKKTSRKPTELD